MKTPASSPDINPIENVWAAMKLYLTKTVKPKKKEELVAGIRDFWNGLSADGCQKFIDHIHKVIPAVVLNSQGIRCTVLHMIMNLSEHVHQERILCFDKDTADILN